MPLPVDTEGLLELTQKVRDTIDGFLAKIGAPGIVRAYATPIMCIPILLFPVAIAIAINGVLTIGSFFATNVLLTIGKVRTENADEFNQVIAASMSEFLGVEISGDELPSGKGPDAMVARMRAIGDKLHDLLTREFGGLSEITAERGAENARAFSGYAINFAVSTAFIAILAEFETLGLVQNVRELGEECAQALGLGRLQRLALQPLIRNMIQQPYDLYLKSKLRPDRLSEAQLIRALRAGQIEEQRVRDELAQKGYRDQDIDILVQDLTAKIAATELSRLVRYDVITQEQALDALTNQGLDQDAAKQLLEATLESRADSQVSGILTDLETARLDGFLSQEDFSSLVQELPLADEEERLFRKKVADQLERPRTTLTFTQMKAGVVAGILDLDYVDKWMENRGYSDDDALYLLYEILLAMEKQSSKEEIAREKAARAAARQLTGR